MACMQTEFHENLLNLFFYIQGLPSGPLSLPLSHTYIHTHAEFTLIQPQWFCRSSCNSQHVLVENKFTCLVIQWAQAVVCCRWRTGRITKNQLSPGGTASSLMSSDLCCCCHLNLDKTYITFIEQDCNNCSIIYNNDQKKLLWSMDNNIL